MRGLFEAVLESIEMGEETWMSDFSHCETMVPCPVKGESRSVEARGDVKKKDKLEVYWCKQYQCKNCSKRSPHLSQIRPDEPAVPVVHVCAACLQRENMHVEHPEQECPKK